MYDITGGDKFYGQKESRNEWSLVAGRGLQFLNIWSNPVDWEDDIWAEITDIWIFSVLSLYQPPPIRATSLLSTFIKSLQLKHIFTTNTGFILWGKYSFLLILYVEIMKWQMYK